MKNSVLILVMSMLFLTGCNAQQKSSLFTNEFTDSTLLDFYTKYSEFTDPGKYVLMYENLPDSLPELCVLIRSQFIHPFSELPMYVNQIPKDRWNEFMKYPSVKLVLEGLYNYDSRGFVKDRNPEHRLVLGCRHSAILLVSILKHRGIPARVRCGHAPYLMPDFHGSHTICEVWNKQEKRWMLVDPSTDKIDFSRDEFDFSNEAWLQLQKGEIDANVYGIPGRYTGIGSIVGKIPADVANVLGTEYAIFQYAPITDGLMEDNNQLSEKQIELLNRISEVMKNLDARSLSELQDIYNSNPDIQITKSSAMMLVDENSSDEIESGDKPDIEFVDIPGGTFIMGSPGTEPGRKGDETQHEVTLSPFKMSKYTITCEQFNNFCKATGRRKMWYGPYGNSKNSVTQITWHDAMAFAQWMGCRLPTEAEFEYATRAGTTTAFYTGDCISTDQANFNGKELYANCGKGENRKKPIPVGSFVPNAFGLYDMHGNMIEWCSDWYGEYNVSDTLNPKGPETGIDKVARGGGWFQSSNECRSAFRDGIWPGNRGAGISFRLVKIE